MGRKRGQTFFSFEQDGKKYLSIGAVARMVGKSNHSLRLWEQTSDKLEANGLARIIPSSTRFGPTKVRCWSLDEIEQIRKFNNGLRNGEIAWFLNDGDKEDSPEVKAKLKKEQKKAQREFKREQKRLINEQKVAAIKQAKGDMIKAIKNHASKVVKID